MICVRCYEQGYLIECSDYCGRCGNGNYFFKEKTMAENKETAMEVWGDRNEIVSLGNRLKVMLPGGQALTNEQAMALAQYSKLADANPFRGEIYAATIKGQVRFIDGYKLLVRWAKRKEAYTEKFVEWDDDRKAKEGLKAEDIAYTCYVLRDSNKSFMIELIRAGTPLSEAYEFLATAASGVVTRQGDMLTNDGKAVQPPKGWTWHDVAKKRSLKNALNVSHGAPSPKEIAQETWMAGDTETVETDWTEIPPDEKDAEVRARYAQLSAINRKNQDGYKEKVANLTPEQNEQRKKGNIDLMRGKADEPGIGDDVEEAVLITSETSGDATELLNDVHQMGGVVVDEAPLIITVEDAAAIALGSYKNEIALGKALEFLMQKKSLAELSEVELWNFTQYCLRRNALMNTSIPFSERMKLIPEFSETPPKKQEEAKNQLHQVFMMFNANGGKMRRMPDHE